MDDSRVTLTSSEAWVEQIAAHGDSKREREKKGERERREESDRKITRTKEVYLRKI